MNFKAISSISLGLFLLSCSTEPELNLDKLEEVNFVTCNLSMRPFNNQNFNQQVFVQRIRYLVDFAFNPDIDQTFGIEGTQVKIFSSDSMFQFEDIGYGIYQYSRGETINPFKSGERYTLQVTFPNGKEAIAEIVTPMIHFEPEQDTIWIQPDSIASWYYIRGGEYPLTVDGYSHQHTIYLDITEGSRLDRPSPNTYEEWHSLYIPQLISPHLWMKMDTTATSITISTASDSPKVFLSEFETREIWLSFSAQHKASTDLKNMEWDDNWPIENLEEISNIEGSYGLFTANDYYIEKSYILALKE